MEKMSIGLWAHAKINLGLDVTGRRGDGYHLLRTVMQSIGLADRVFLERTAEPGIALDCGDAALAADETNLAWRAAALFFRETGVSGGVRIRLEKHIPMGAGLAGGSTDAAAVLTGMDRLFDTGLGLEKLQTMGVRLGADIPFCLQGGTLLAEGIGEVLTPLPPCGDLTVLLAKPGVSVSTPAVYRALDAMDPPHPDIDGLIRALGDGSVPGADPACVPGADPACVPGAGAAEEAGTSAAERLAPYLGNVLEDVTAPQIPVIGRIEEAMRRTGAAGACMSGSGPTVFGLFADRDAAQRAREALEAEDFGEPLFLAVTQACAQSIEEIK